MDIDTNRYNINEIKSIAPIIIKKKNIIYYCFDIEQVQYIFNSFQQRDFYINKYNQKKRDFNKIVILYEEKIINLDSMIAISNQKLIIKDTLCINKNKKLVEIEDEYKKQIKKTRMKVLIAGGSGLLLGLILGLIF